LAPARKQFQQDLVQLADHPGVVLPDPPAAIDQQPQHLQGLVADDFSQPSHADPDQGDGVRVGVAGLAALPSGIDRILADNFAGTSTTCSPASRSRNTKCRGMFPRFSGLAGAVFSRCRFRASGPAR
jgi:hypothetical protein